MKKHMERLTAFLLSVVTLFTVSSCAKRVKEKGDNEEINSVSDIPLTNTTDLEMSTTFPTEEDLSCGCLTEPDNVSICLPETTVKKIETTTVVPTTILGDTTTRMTTTTMPEITTESTTKEIVTTTVPTTKPTQYGLSITCSDPIFVISDELRSKIEKTIKNFNSSNVAFSLYDINTGLSINYNETEGFNGACIVKPGIVLYLLTLAEKNELDLNIKIKYPGNLVSGSGYLNGYYNGYQAYNGQEFTILELMYHTLYYSDNNGYRLLYRYVIDNGYYDDYKDLMERINVDSLTVSKNSMWVRQANSSDGVNMILALNDFINSSQNGMNVNMKFVDGGNLSKSSGQDYLTYGQILYWIMINGKYDYLENYTGITSLTKTGFVSGSGDISCRNDISLCYADNPYALCLLTKYNDEELRKSTVKSLLKDLNEVMNEYNKYRKESNRLILHQ